MAGIANLRQKVSQGGRIHLYEGGPSDKAGFGFGNFGVQGRSAPDSLGRPGGGNKPANVGPKVTPKQDTAEFLDNLLGPSPNLDKAEEVQRAKFDRDKKNKINQNAILNFLNKKIVNPYVDAMYNVGLPLSQLTPTQFGLFSLYGNMFNFNPKKDEETGEISTSILGDTGTATFGKLNFENYKDYKGLANRQDFYDAAFDFDEKGNYIGTDFEALETYTDNMGMVLKDDMDLEQNLIDRREEDRRQTRGPSEEYIPPSTGTTSGVAAAGTGTTQGSVDYQGIYNNFSPDQRATADKIMAMDEYDLPYAVDYVRMGGPLF
jgi:hypothetical protein